MDEEGELNLLLMGLIDRRTVKKTDLRQCLGDFEKYQDLKDLLDSSWCCVNAMRIIQYFCHGAFEVGQRRH